MKTIFFAIGMFFSFSCFSQDKVVKDTTIKNISYKVYEGSKGGKYIVVTSKTGNQYKKYFKKA